MTPPRPIRTLLRRDGYAVIPDILDPTLLARLRQRYADAALAGMPPEVRGESGLFQVLDVADELTVELLAWHRTLSIFRALGHARPKLHSFYVSAKHPGAAPLLWHKDIPYDWSSDGPPELLVIYPLRDTETANGCLREIMVGPRSLDPRLRGLVPP